MAFFYGDFMQLLEVRRLRPPASILWFLPDLVRAFYSPPWMDSRSMLFMAFYPKDDDGFFFAIDSI